MPKKILLIVEGESDEVKFLRGLFEHCLKKAEYKFYSYKTNIHTLAQELYNNYPDFDEGDVDIRLVLASLESSKEKKEMLLDKYSDIYMVFDFEPQHDHKHFDTVRRMVNYFNDSTNQGQLFINYPMMQSYKHFDCLPCPSFEFCEVTLEQSKGYKQYVGEISNFTDLTKYTYVTYFSIAVHQLKKANKILNGGYTLPSKSEYFDFKATQIFDYQVNLLESSNNISVLNTCIFALVDFAPSKFFAFVSRHKDDLLI
jgi:hypothetical protein